MLRHILFNTDLFAPEVKRSIGYVDFLLDGTFKKGETAWLRATVTRLFKPLEIDTPAGCRALPVRLPARDRWCAAAVEVHFLKDVTYRHTTIRLFGKIPKESAQNPIDVTARDSRWAGHTLPPSLPPDPRELPLVRVGDGFQAPTTARADAQLRRAAERAHAFLCDLFPMTQWSAGTERELRDAVANLGRALRNPDEPKGDE